MECERGEDGTFKTSFYEFFEKSLLIVFGDFSPVQNEFTAVPWFLFMLMIIFMMIVMFNMLVAIAGETYTTFMAKQDQVSNSIFADIIFEMETFIFWRRTSKNKYGYVVYAEEV